jgi:hypothetical protein
VVNTSSYPDTYEQTVCGYVTNGVIWLGFGVGESASNSFMFSERCDVLTEQY